MALACLADATDPDSHDAETTCGWASELLSWGIAGNGGAIVAGRAVMPAEPDDLTQASGDATRLR